MCCFCLIFISCRRIKVIVKDISVKFGDEFMNLKIVLIVIGSCFLGLLFFCRCYLKINKCVLWVINSVIL